MKQNKTRFLAMLLSIAMVLSLMPTMAFAAEAEDNAVGIAEQWDEYYEAHQFDAAPMSTDDSIPSTTIGGSDNPFKIGNATVLQEFADLVEDGASYGTYSYADASYVLTADIDMSGKDWTAISGFNGSFDGAGYIIYYFDATDGVFADDPTGATNLLATSLYKDALWDGISTSAPTNNEITSAAELAYLATATSALSGTYTLTTDIDLGGNEWTPIGNLTNKFTATFDGDGYEIIGLSIASNSDGYAGLFGYSTGTIKNLTVSGSVSAGADSYSNSYAGGIVGYNDAGTVTNCVNHAKVSATGWYSGGIVGINKNAGTVSYCENTGDIISKSGRVGGIVGSNDTGGYVAYCVNTGAVSGTTQVGGITGYADTNNGTMTVEYCVNTGDVTGTTQVGGVVGQSMINGNGATTVQYNYSTGSVSGTSNVGGIVGENYVNGSGTATVQYNVSLGENVTSTDSSTTIGKIVGYNYGGTVTDNYAWAGMTVTSSATDTLTGDNGTALYYIDAYGFNENASASTATTWATIFGGDTYWTGDITELPNGDAVPAYISSATVEPVTDDLWTSYKADGLPVGNVITTAEELAFLAYNVNAGYNGYQGQTITLGADIDLSAHEWVAIGISSSDRRFNCTFDGAGYKITGLNIDSDSNYQGLFGYVSGATIKDVTVYGEVTSTGNYVGGIVGYNDSSSITNCANYASVSGSSNVGGVVGYIYNSEITGSYNTGDIESKSTDSYSYTGGIVGRSYSNDNSSSISNCYNTGDITSSGGSNGGIAGSTQGKITNAYNTGNITSSGSYNGGITGNFKGGSITNCYNTGNISGKNDTGGVVGYMDSSSAYDTTVSYCYNTGNVSGASEVGGIAGDINYTTGYNTTKISNCVSLANTITASSYVGRVIGDNSNVTLENNYAWSGTVAGNVKFTLSDTTKATTGTDGADLYYASGSGFVTDGGAFDWTTICPTANGWTAASDDNYQLPTLMSETSQNPLANITFVTVTFEDASDNKILDSEEEEISLSAEGSVTVTSTDLPENYAFGTVGDDGAISDWTDTIYYASTTIQAVSAEASVGDTSYTTIELAIAAANAKTDATVKLLADTEIEEKLEITKTMTLDLNGFDIQQTEENERVIYVNSNDAINFTLKDDTTAKERYVSAATSTGVGTISDTATDGSTKIIGGAIYGGSDEYMGGGIYYGGQGAFAMTGGNVVGNTVTLENGCNGGGIGVESTSTSFTMTGGTVAGNVGTNGGGIYTQAVSTSISGDAVIANNKGTNGGGIYFGSNSANSELAIESGAEISNNTATDGGGIYVNGYSSTATVTIDGGEISNNIASNGSGVYGTTSSKVDFKSGKISNNTSTSQYGGVYLVNTAEFNMSGGEISDNGVDTTWSSISGGGVYVGENATFNMTGGSITDNYLTTDYTPDAYGPNYYGASVYALGALNVSGDVTIDQGLIEGDDGDGVYLANANTITIANTMGDDASIYFTATEDVDGTYTPVALEEFGDSVTFATSSADYSTSASGVFSTSVTDGMTTMLVTESGYTYTLMAIDEHHCGEDCGCYAEGEAIPVYDYDSLVAAATNADAADYYYLAADIDTTAEVTVSGTFNLCLNGHSITAGADSANTYSVITIGSSATLNLYDYDGTGTISGGNNGVYISGGTFNMYGGTITENDDYGVEINLSGTFNMYGGTVSGNEATLGDICVYGNMNVKGSPVTGTVYLDSSNTINVIGALEAGAYIKVRIPNNANSQKVVVDGGDYLSADDESYFEYYSDACSIIYRTSDDALYVVGTTKITATAYDFSYADETEVTYDGTAKSATVSMYDDSSATITLSYKRTLDGDGNALTTEETAIAEPINAGTYTVYASITSSAYFTGTDIELGTLVIEQADTIENYTSSITGDGATISYSTTTATYETVLTYSVELHKASDDADYPTGTITLYAQHPDTNQYYDLTTGEAINSTSDATEVELVNGAYSATPDYDLLPALQNSGQYYYITFTYSGDDNYDGIGSSTRYLKLGTKTVELEVSNTSHTYDGTAKSITVANENTYLDSSDFTVSYYEVDLNYDKVNTTAVTNAINYGTYLYVIDFADDVGYNYAIDNEYDMTSFDGALPSSTELSYNDNIGLMEISTVSADVSQSAISFGTGLVNVKTTAGTSTQAVINSNSGATTTYAISGGSATIDSESGKVTFTEAGYYTITATSTLDGTTPVTATYYLSVTNEKLTITATDVSVNYGDTAPDYSYTAVDESGDTVTFATEPTATSSYSATSKVGQYNITVSGAVATGYDITYVSGTLTVAEKELKATDLTFEISNKTFDNGTTATGTGSYAGDSALTVNFTATFDNENVGENKTVTITNISFSGTTSANYTIESTETATETADITEANVTIISASSTTAVYDGEAKPVTISAFAMVNGFDDSALTVYYAKQNETDYDTATTTAPIAVGTYKVTVAITDSNFTTDFTGATLIIKEASQDSFTIEGVPDSISYGDTFTVTNTAIDSANVTYAVGEGEPATIDENNLVTITGVGSVTITATSTADNYASKSVTKTFTAKQKELSFTATATDRAYNGSTAVDVAIVLGNVITADVENISASATGTTVTADAGSGKLVYVTGITLTGDTASYYTIATTAQTTVTINQKEITAFEISAEGKVYDGTDVASATVESIDGVIGTDDVTVLGTAVFNSADVEDAETVTFTATGLSGTSASNYELTATSATDTATITTMPLTFTVGTTSFVYDEDAKTVEVTAYDNNNNVVTDGYEVSANEETLAGDYELTIALTSSNYSTTDTLTHDWSIVNAEQTDLAITGIKGTVAYGDEFTLGTAGGATGATIAWSSSHDDVTVTNGAVTVSGAVGEYVTITATATADNYESTSATWSFVPTAKNVSFTLGNTTAIYNGETKSVTVTTDAGENYTVTYNGSETLPTNAGTYSVYVVATGNYSGQTFGTLTIDKATLTATGVSASGGTYNGTAYTATGTVSNSVTPTLKYSTLTGEAPIDAGTYTVVATYENANYETATATANFEITKATLTVTAVNATRYYGEANPDFTVQYSGWVNGEGVSALTAEPTAKTTAGSSSAAGYYDITVSGGSATNYAFDYVAGKLTIEALDSDAGTLTISGAPAIFTVGDITQLTARFGVAYPTVAWSTSNASIISVDKDTGVITAVGTGTATITAAVTDASYAEDTTATVEITVSAATQDSFQILSTNYYPVYGDEAFTLSAYGATGEVTYVSSDTSVATIDDSTVTIVKPGPFTITATSELAGSADKEAHLTLNISKKAVTVTAVDATITYGDDAPTFTYTVVGDVESNPIEDEATFTTRYTTSPATGEFDINVSGISSDYYIIAFTSGTLTVSPKTLTADDFTFKAVDKVYDGSVVATGSTVSFDDDAIENGDNVTVSATANFASLAVGTGITVNFTNLVLGGTKADNYELATGITGTGTADITAAEAGTLFIIGGTTLLPTQTSELTALIDGKATTNDVTWVSSDTDVATVTAGTVTAVATGTATITATTTDASGNELTATITIIVNSTNEVLVADKSVFTYTGDVQAMTFTVDGAAFTDVDITYTLLDDVTEIEFRNVGTYYVTAISTSDSVVASYTGIVAIGKADVTLTTDAKTKTYGDANPDFTVTGLLGTDVWATYSDMFTVTTEADETTDVGTYDITMALAEGHSLSEDRNYNFTIGVNGLLTIEQRALTISVADVTREYGDENPDPVLTGDNFVNDDDFTVLTGENIFTWTDFEEAVGTYDDVVTASGYTNEGNYTVTYAYDDGEGADLTITKIATSMTGSGKASYMTIKLSEEVTGLDETNFAVAGVALTSVKENSGTSYTLYGTFTVGTAYTVSLDLASDTIENPADITVTPTSTSSGGSGGSSSSSSSTTYYDVTIADTENGTVTTDDDSYEAGETVEIEVTPDDGYVVYEVTVIDEDDNEIDVTDYEFTMPSGDVTVTVTFVFEMSFTDVDDDDYYYDAVLWAVENGITSGTETGIFSPEMDCTRAQAVTFLWNLMDKPEADGENPFVDVDEDAYYNEAVLWAVENGIINGVSETEFAPDEVCSRAHIVAILHRLAGEPEADTDTANPFADVADDAYYYDAVLWAVEIEITNGTSDDTFEPDTSCTRAQIVTFLYRYIAQQ